MQGVRTGIAMLAFVMLAGCGGGSKTLVEYGRVSNGIIIFRVDLRVDEDGSASASTDHAAGCAAGPAAIQVDDATMSRLRTALAEARLGETASSETGGVNAQTWEIRSAGHTFRWYSQQPFPQRLEPLIGVLDRIMADACGN